MKTRFQQKGSSTYSPNVKAPGRARAFSNRGLIGLILAILLPPIGLLYLWRSGVFRTRGRMLVSIVSTIEMLVVCLLLIPKEEMISYLPAPQTPVAVTAAPASDTLNALSNIEQLLYEQQLANVVAAGGDATDLMTDEEKAEAEAAEREEVLNTIVYAVYRGAVRYHAIPICGNQSNNRELTVREAQQEGLAVCPDCNPPY